MRNPYEQPSRRAGRSLQREEPDSQWEQQSSSSGSSEPPEQEIPADEQPEQEATPTNAQVDPTTDDPLGEEVVNLWEAEDPPDMDYVVEQATRSSVSCMRQALFVLEMRMVRLNPTLQVRRLLSSKNGAICLDLSELL